MTIPIRMSQDDQALRLLAHMYARWFMRESREPMVAAYEQIRDVLYTALNQHDAYDHLTHLVAVTPATESSPRKAYEQARDTVAQVIHSGGQTETLLVGETDGYRHVCLICSQDEQNFRRVPFFNQQERRPLLKPEVQGGRRSAYARCQCCLQPINPTAYVLFVQAGTEKHANGCSCRRCNRASIASLLNIYAWDAETQQIGFPSLQHILAPSRQQCLEQAIEHCWEKGWYMLNKDSARS